jgi:hypothetical protein
MSNLPVDEMVKDAEALARQFSDGSNPIRDTLTADVICHVKALAAEYEKQRDKAYSEMLVAQELQRSLNETSEELEQLKTFASHAGILKAQEIHNKMMREKDAEIEKLRKELAQKTAEHADVVRRKRRKDAEIECLRLFERAMESMAAQFVCPKMTATELAQKQLKQVPAEPRRDKPTVICLCGSTRFADQHAVARWELEKQGAIVLMINYLPAWYADQQGWDGNDHFGEKSGLKERLDELHMRKIDLADKVMVINVGGYIGESTRREIEYAESTGKPVEYLEPLTELAQKQLET